jgi:hypothetical protein
MEKKLTNSGPLREPADKHSIYTDEDAFISHWKLMRNKFDPIILFGKPCFFKEYKGETLHIPQYKNKKISLYISIDRDYLKYFYESIELYNDFKELFNIYHIEGFAWGFFVIGSDDRDENIEILMKNTSSSDERPHGFYIGGDTAKRSMQSLRYHVPKTHAIPASLRENSYGPVRIDSKAKVHFILEQQFLYLRELAELRYGGPKRGTEEICECMSQALQETHKYSM